MLAEGRSLIRQRNAIEDRAVELQGDRPDYQLLRTIPGIGPINALTILAETGDLRRFHHPLPGNGLLANHERDRQFLKFCGMDLATVQSGMFRGRSNIQIWQCSIAAYAVVSRPDGGLEESQQLPGQVRALHRTRSP
jgi:hypothetical protein